MRTPIVFEESFSRVRTKNVFPILGRFDQFIVYERQKQSYQDKTHIKVQDTGHITSPLRADELRNSIAGIDFFHNVEGKAVRSLKDFTSYIIPGIPPPILPIPPMA